MAGELTSEPEATEPKADENVNPEAGAAEDQATDKKVDTETPEVKTDTPAGESDSKAENKEDAADEDKPVEYTDFNLAKDFTLADADIAAFKAAGLKQEQAQALIDYETSRVREQLEAQQKALDDQRDTWVSEAKQDKEYGGQNYEKSIGIARDAIRKFGNPALAEMLDSTGLSDHPELIRFAYNIGKLTQQDGPGDANNNPSASLTLAERIFPNHK